MREHLFARTVVDKYLLSKMSEDDLKDHVHSKLANDLSRVMLDHLPIHEAALMDKPAVRFETQVVIMDVQTYRDIQEKLREYDNLYYRRNGVWRLKS